MLQVFKTLLDRDTPKLESAMNKEKQNVEFICRRINSELN